VHADRNFRDIPDDAVSTIRLIGLSGCSGSIRPSALNIWQFSSCRTGFPRTPSSSHNVRPDCTAWPAFGELAKAPLET